MLNVKCIFTLHLTFYFLHLTFMNYLEFDFETEDERQSEYLVALLDAQGFIGFEESGNTLRAYIPEDDFNAVAFGELLNAFSSVAYTLTVVEERNWNKK